MKLDFTKLKDCMVFHSCEYKIIGNLISWGETSGKPSANTPNHITSEWTGFMMYCYRGRIDR